MFFTYKAKLILSDCKIYRDLINLISSFYIRFSWILNHNFDRKEKESIYRSRFNNVLRFMYLLRMVHGEFFRPNFVADVVSACLENDSQALKRRFLYPFSFTQTKNKPYRFKN